MTFPTRRLRTPRRAVYFAATALFCIPVLCWLGCQKQPDAARGRLHIVVAASLTDVVDQLAAQFAKTHAARPDITSGASGRLGTQIAAGMPCDVFIPADPDYLDALEKKKRLASGSRVALAANALVIVAPVARAASWPSAARLGEPNVKKIAIANPDHAPAGARAREALEKLGLWKTLEPRLVFADDVRMAAKYAAAGAVDAAIIYATDAIALEKEVAVVFRFDPTLHAPIRYVGAVSTNAPNPELARAFLDFAAGPEQAACWRVHGFAAP